MNVRWTPKSASVFYGSIALAFVGAFMAVKPAAAQVSLGSTQRAEDGTVYEVIIVPTGSLLAGADEFRVTSVAGSAVGLQSCSTTGALSGDPASALSGGDLLVIPPQVLHPFSDTTRTHIFTPNDIGMVAFQPNGSGRLTIGTGGGAFDVCRQAANCAAGAVDVSVVALTDSGGGVPAACVANGVPANCASGTRTTLGFGIPSTGDACNTPPTTNSTVCGMRPTDGFTLGSGQVVVFIYNGSLGGSGFSIGAGGFGVDTDGSNVPNCAANLVVSAAAQNQSAPSLPFTPTPTSTPTFTETPTFTPTLTPTETFTVTPTFTPTNTFTPTVTPTDTRPPVPVVSSPASPAGLLMIAALAIGLVWALRRFTSTSP